MEPVEKYKLLPKPRQNLFRPPEYCRKAEKVEYTLGDPIYQEELVPHLNLEVTNPAKILNLCESLSDNATRALEIKVNRYLRIESLSRVVFLINIHHSSEEAIVQVVNDSILKKPYRVNLLDGFTDNVVVVENQCLKCGESLDANITSLIEEIIGEEGGEVLTVPVICRGRANIYCENLNAFPAYMVCFVDSHQDESYIVRLVNECFRFIITIMMNTVESEEESRLKRQCQALLNVARKLFSHLGDINDLLKEIMVEARLLTNAERCSLFILDQDTKELVARVFDGATSNEAQIHVRIALDQGIAGHVAATGNLLNIKDAYEHPLFFKGMDETTGFKTRNILCFPIRDEEGVVGVAQLCNKITGGNFDYFDEEVANAFSIYCGLSIVHSLMYKKIHDSQARNKLSNELMMYHMKVSRADIADLVMCPGNHHHPDLDKFYFSPREIILKETPCFILSMIEELNFIEGFKVRKDILACFILFVKKGYRDTPYHNWWHAFSVAHFAYLCIKNFDLINKGYLTKLECFAYVISCLCHDLDHRGTTNSFQQQSNNTLASLYSSEGSVMERHHLSQTLCILNTEGCNFLENLTSQEYSRCLDYIKDMILATDLANHFRVYRRQLLMVQEGYKRNKNEHRFALVSLLMTCADLSDQTKNWSVVKKVAQNVYEEFFKQGDLEKQMGKSPLQMMDREKASIPDLQIEFLKNVCLPVYQLLVIMFPHARIMVDNIKKNMLCWETSKKIFEKFTLEGKISLEALTSPSLENEVIQIVDEVMKP